MDRDVIMGAFWSWMGVEVLVGEDAGKKDVIVEALGGLTAEGGSLRELETQGCVGDYILLGRRNAMPHDVVVCGAKGRAINRKLCEVYHTKRDEEEIVPFGEAQFSKRVNSGIPILLTPAFERLYLPSTPSFDLQFHSPAS